MVVQVACFNVNPCSYKADYSIFAESGQAGRGAVDSCSHPLTNRTSSSSSGSSLMTMTGPGDDRLRRLADEAEGGSELCLQDVVL